jgi:hypothetical protein
MDMISAYLTRERVASGHKIMLSNLATILTENPIRESVIFQPLQASRIIRELLFEVRERVLVHVRYPSLPTLMVSYYLPTVKGYSPNLFSKPPTSLYAVSARITDYGRPKIEKNNVNYSSFEM